MKSKKSENQRANCIAPNSAFQAVRPSFAVFCAPHSPYALFRFTGNLVLQAAGFCGISLSCLAAFAQPPSFLSGNEFLQQINRPLLVNWDLTPLQDVLDRLSAERHAAILLDRRINPSQLVPVELQSSFFDTGIEKLVGTFGGVSIVGDTLFVAPPETSESFLTRVVLSERQLEERLKSDLGRKLDLGERIPVIWDEGTSAKDLLDRVAASYRLTIANPELIPHDQWRGGQIRNPNATEALLLIATQFDLDIEWVDGNHVRLIPQAKNPVIKVEHTLRNLTPQQALTRIRKLYPQITMTAVKGKVVVTDREEVQREVAVLLGNRMGRTPASDLSTIPLSRRRFTLRMQERPFLELITVLEKQGIPIQRDSVALEEAGIDLQTRISLQLENARIETLLTEACRPVGVSFQVDESRVVLLLMK